MTTTNQRKAPDPELGAINWITKILDALEPPVRRRVCRYLFDRYDAPPKRIELTDDSEDDARSAVDGFVPEADR